MKKYIILALVALLAAVLFVACDNDVKVDNNTAYTEVLESEGAFVVNGKGYDTLQSAIQAAVGGKTSADPVVITMTRNITSRPVVIPEDSKIKLDLGGYKLTFIDVEKNAFSVGKAYFVLENGAVALLDETAELRLIHAEDDARVVLSHIAPVTGCVDITGSYLDVVYCYLNDLRMTNSRLGVNRSGHVVLTSIVGDNHFVVTDPDTAITNETEVDIDDDVESGVCYIQRGEVISYYGSLQAALDDLDADNLTIIFRDDYDESELAVEAGAGRPVIIDLNGYNVTVASIKADGALTIVNSRVPNLPAASAIFTGNITAAGTFLVNCNVDEDVFGKVVINGAVTAGGLGIYAYNAEFTGAVGTTGLVEALDCTFSGSVVAEESIFMGDSTISPAEEFEESGILVQSSKNINLENVKFDCSDFNLASVFANKGGNISMTKCTGNVGDITAKNVAGSEPGNITIDNSEVSETLSLYTRDLEAADITVYANSANKVIVLGSVTGAAVTAGSPANNSVKKGATFYGNISASDSVVIYSAKGYVDAIHTNALYIASDESFKVGVVNAAAPVDESGKATVIINGGKYFSVNLSGEGVSDIYGGEFGYYDSLSYGNFTYNGTGTLNVTGGYFNGITKFLSGSSIVLNGTYSGDGDGVAVSSNYSLVFDDIDAVTDNVHIKSAYITENSLDDVVELVHRINQDSVSEQAQQIYINYNPYGKEFLTGVDNVFNMTSANIQSAGSAYLNYTMYETDEYETDNVVTSGLIVGENGKTPASATFNYNNGSGKQLKVTGRIGLLAGGNVIYSTQPHNNLVYGCTYGQVNGETTTEDTTDDVYGYVIGDKVNAAASTTGYYEYRN